LEIRIRRKIDGCYHILKKSEKEKKPLNKMDLNSSRNSSLFLTLKVNGFFFQNVYTTSVKKLKARSVKKNPN